MRHSLLHWNTSRQSYKDEPINCCSLVLPTVCISSGKHNLCGSPGQTHSGALWWCLPYSPFFLNGATFSCSDWSWWVLASRLLVAFTMQWFEFVSSAFYLFWKGVTYIYYLHIYMRLNIHLKCIHNCLLEQRELDTFEKRAGNWHTRRPLRKGVEIKSELHVSH